MPVKQSWPNFYKENQTDHMVTNLATIMPTTIKVNNLNKLRTIAMKTQLSMQLTDRKLELK